MHMYMSTLCLTVYYLVCEDAWWISSIWYWFLHSAPIFLGFLLMGYVGCLHFLQWKIPYCYIMVLIFPKDLNAGNLCLPVSSPFFHSLFLCCVLCYTWRIVKTNLAHILFNIMVNMNEKGMKNFLHLGQVCSTINCWFGLVDSLTKQNLPVYVLFFWVILIILYLWHQNNYIFPRPT